jgi:hypothetical protein
MIMTNAVYSPLSGDVLPDRTIRFSCALELPASAGELRLTSTDPHVQPHFDCHYLEDPWDRQKCPSMLPLLSSPFAHFFLPSVLFFTYRIL